MSKEIDIQSAYWDRESASFESIYSHQKSAFSNWLDKVFRKDMFQRFEFTMKHGAPFAGRSYLDVGCGSGLYSVEFAKRGGERVLGIDIAEHMVGLSQELARREGVEAKCTFKLSDLLALETNERFDVSIGIGLFDYVTDPLPVLKKMREVTTGSVIASFPRLWTWRAPIRKVRLALRGCPVRFFSRGEVEQLMRSAGFDHTYIEKVGKLYCVVGYCTPA